MPKIKRKKSRRTRRSADAVQAEVLVRAVMQPLFRAVAAFPVGSRRHQAVIGALYALTRVFK